MTLSSGWHPFLVHFPIALTLTAALLFVIARLVKGAYWSATLSTVATVNICLAAVAVLLAIVSGVAAVVDLHVDELARQAISAHVKWAVFTSVALLLLAVWRGAGSAPASRPSALFLVMLLVASLAIYRTGSLGLQNVFEHGVGLDPATLKK